MDGPRPFPPPAAGRERSADELVERALAGVGLGLAFQPIVDLGRGVVAGYEALARFEGAPAGLTPDACFQAARARGLVARLDAAVAGAAFAARASLPRDCFLSVNLEPDSVGSPCLEERLLAEGRLEGVVLELTEHVGLGVDDRIERHAELYRRRGAVVAIDDAGSGYAGLQQILRLRPGILKLDRSLVAGIDADEAKRSLVEMLGVFADRMDAWILAEGVERGAEAATLAALGVPLAQGYYFARPAAGFTGIRPEARAELLAQRPANAAASSGAVDALLVASPTVALGELDRARSLLAGDERLDVVVVLDATGHAVGLVDRDCALAGGVRVPLAVQAGSGLAETARRMLHRHGSERFDPVLCHDGQGRYLGTLRAERLVAALADLAAEATPIERPA